jgi:uncharacterized protein YecE (DUF72 family)
MGQTFIGAGGWAYFDVPSLSPLKAYSKAFDYVEVNSTFYEIPPLSEAERWRTSVPGSFHFSVRAHKSITHGKPFEDTESVQDSLARMVEVCRILRADVLHFQLPPLAKPDGTLARAMSTLLGSIDGGSLLFALELRGEVPLRAHPGLLEMMQDRGIIHSVDLLKGGHPDYKNDTLYSRLFGQGYHNLYQPTDDELRSLDDMVSGFSRAYLTFHGAKMYSDAARMKSYIRSGTFPKVTKATGLESLKEALAQDARFPTSKAELILDQGWKLYDFSDDERIRVVDTLSRLPEGNYESLEDVIRVIENRGDIRG